MKCYLYESKLVEIKDNTDFKRQSGSRLLSENTCALSPEQCAAVYRVESTGSPADTGSSFKRKIIVFILKHTKPISFEPLMCGFLRINKILHLIQLNEDEWECLSLVLSSVHENAFWNRR